MLIFKYDVPRDVNRSISETIPSGITHLALNDV